MVIGSVVVVVAVVRVLRPAAAAQVEVVAVVAVQGEAGGFGKQVACVQGEVVVLVVAGIQLAVLQHVVEVQVFAVHVEGVRRREVGRAGDGGLWLLSDGFGFCRWAWCEAGVFVVMVTASATTAA